MKTLAIIITAAALLAGGSGAAEADFRDAYNLAQVPPAHLLRRVDDKVVDLRPWLAWRGRVNAARTAFMASRAAVALRASQEPCPLAGWGAVVGEMKFIRPDGDVVVEMNRANVLLRNWPGKIGAVTGDWVNVLARQVGTSTVEAASGTGLTVRVFDYGQPLPPEEIAAWMQKEAEAGAKANAVKAQAAAEAAAQRKADAAARVEKARAERAAKEAAEKPPVK